MNVSIQYKCDDFRPQVDQDIARYSAKLERWLSHYDSDLLLLHACYKKHARKHLYLCILNMKLPGSMLHSSAANAEARFAVRGAFDELEIQVNRHRSRARRDYEWKRKRERSPAAVGA